MYCSSFIRKCRVLNVRVSVGLVRAFVENGECI